MTTQPTQADYGEKYYRNYCGGVPYERSEPHWAVFFDGVAKAIAESLNPKTVFDAGCAKGFLIEALRKRDMEAFGRDFSDYAINDIPTALRQFCTLGSITDLIEGSYDLVTCIEVLEHMTPEGGEKAIGNLCRAAPLVLFSSSPDEFSEPTHINVQPPRYWLELFAKHGFGPRADHDPSYLCPWAMLLERRETAPGEHELVAYAKLVASRREMARRAAEAHQVLQRHVGPLEAEISRLSLGAMETQEKIARLTEAYREAQEEISSLTHANNEAVEKVARLAAAYDESRKEINRLGDVDQMLVERGATLASLERSLQDLYASSSWRVTAPLRFGGRQVRRLKRAFCLLPDAIQRAGGFGSLALRAVCVLRREGLDGLRSRLRFLEAARRSASDVPSEVEVHGADDWRIVPYYVDPRLDTQSPQCVHELSVAVHLHLFYDDMLEEIAERLANIPCSFDLYVSIPEGSDQAHVGNRLKARLPRAGKIDVEKVPNRGRDLAPLIVQFGQQLSRYGIIGHFHTKKSPHNASLSNWGEELLDHLLGGAHSSGGRIAHFFALLQSNVKIIYPEGRIEFSNDKTGWADNREIARGILERYTSISIDAFPRVEFPQGSMFWARGACLREFLSLPLTFEEFPVEPVGPDSTLAHALERLILVLTQKSQGQFLRLHRKDSVMDYRFYEDQKDFKDSIVHVDVKMLAYYLPQFHPIPENDEWHGQGFTEWTKVMAANPLFEGHYQQHIPHSDIGYYLLDKPDALRVQADTMKKAGVSGMVFYHYWFGGRMILEKPAQMLLDNTDINMPFCFCWANENWTRRWDGNESEILLAQDYSPEDARAFIQYLIPFFQDARYIRVDGRPALFVYRPSSIPDSGIYIDVWSEECRAVGLEPPYLVAVLTRGATHPSEFGMDAGVERVLHDWTAGAAAEIKPTLKPYAPLNGSVLSYDDVASFYEAQKDTKDFTYFRSVVPIWDNTARYGSEAYIVHGSTPVRFQTWLENAISYSERDLPADRRFILVNAWNEWAEGAHLEPDTRYGYAYLNAVGRALSHIPYPAQPSPAQSKQSPEPYR